MQDRSAHWHRAEQLLADASREATQDQLIAMAAVHAQLATGNQPIDLDLDRGPGETLAQLAARTAAIATRVASTARELSEDATASGDQALALLGRQLAGESQTLARIAAEIRVHLA